MPLRLRARYANRALAGEALCPGPVRFIEVKEKRRGKLPRAPVVAAVLIDEPDRHAAVVGVDIEEPAPEGVVHRG